MTRSREALFVDPSVSDIEIILGHVRPGIEATLLDGVRPVAHQIVAALANRRDLDAVHVIAHGSPGRVHFTAGDWSVESAAAEAEDLAAIGRALGPDCDLRLWSCHTGAGPTGAAFVKRLAQATGGEVAAASGQVGAAARGGSWQLTALSNRAAPQPPLTTAGLARYAGVLETLTWTGATSTAWNTATNWSGTIQRVPANGDDVVISGTPTRQPTLNVSSNNLNSLTISGVNTLTMGAVTLHVANTTSSAITVGTGSTISITGGTITTGTAGGISNTGMITNVSGTSSITGGAVTNNAGGEIRITAGSLSFTGGAISNSGFIGAFGGTLTDASGIIQNGLIGFGGQRHRRCQRQRHPLHQ